MSNNVSIIEAARELNEAYKTEREKKLEQRIEQLEKILVNVINRLDSIEKYSLK